MKREFQMPSHVGIDPVPDSCQEKQEKHNVLHESEKNFQRFDEI